MPWLAGIAALAILSPARADLPVLEWKTDLPQQDNATLISWRFEPDEEEVDYVAPAMWTPNGKFGGGVEIRIPSDPGKNENFAKARHDPALPKSGSITVDLWVKPDIGAMPEEQAYGYLFDQMYAGNEGIALYLSRKTHQLTAKVGNGRETLYVRTSRIGFEPGQWRHIAVSYNGETGSLRLFLDGALVAEKADASFGPLAPGGRAFRVGNRQGPLYMPLPSVIDNFRVTNHAARFEP